MITMARRGYTKKEISDALRAKNGSLNIRFRFDILRNGSKIKQANATGRVSLNRFAEIERTAEFTLYEELDWLKDEIKPYMILNVPSGSHEKRIWIMPCRAFDSANFTMDSFDALNVTGDDLDAGYIGSDGVSAGSWSDRDGLRWSWEKWDAQQAEWADLDVGVIRLPETAEFPLGVFIPSSPKRQSRDGMTAFDVSAYDRTVILQEDSLPQPLFIAKGTAYITAVEAILEGAGIVNVMVADRSESVLPTDREFEVGSKKLGIINALLGEINFNKIRCNADGTFIISQYREPSLDRVDYTYAADELSIISRNTASDLDLYSVPNVFVAICSNPDLEEDYRSVFVNDSAASKLSTVSRGRTITSEIYQPEVIASQAALDDYIRRIAWGANQVYEQLDFSTALMPIHESGDSLQIIHPDVSGIFVESSWELDLDAQSTMSHRARRLVQV